MSRTVERGIVRRDDPSEVSAVNAANRQALETSGADELTHILRSRHARGVRHLTLERGARDPRRHHRARGRHRLLEQPLRAVHLRRPDARFSITRRSGNCRRLSVPLSPQRDTPVAGRPLVNLTFAINYAAGGLDPRGYRLTNLAIHLLAALTLFGLVRRTLRLPSLAPRFGEQATNLAWVAALIWMLHPLQTETIDYVTQRTESMMGLFYLLTLYCSVRALEGRPGRWHVAAIVACAAGMACKESMVTAPVMVGAVRLRIRRRSPALRKVRRVPAVFRPRRNLARPGGDSWRRDRERVSGSIPT